MKNTAELVKYDGEDAIITSFDLDQELKSNGGYENIFKVTSEFAGLEELLQGFESGELISVSGPRKSGKTLLMQTLTYHFQKSEAFPLWFQFENTPIQFLRAFEKQGLPFFTLPRKLRIHALDWMEERIYESMLKHRTKVVIIDHLHFLFDLARNRNASLEIGQVIRKLKKFCIDYNIIVFLMCHMRKTKLSQEPSDDDIRDSSFVSQESDVGLLIWREGDSNYARLKVAFSRRTGVLDQKIKLEKKDNLLVEISDGRLPEEGGDSWWQK